jgi:hypothetical protein
MTSQVIDAPHESGPPWSPPDTDRKDPIMRALLSSPTALFRVDAVTCAAAALALLVGAGPAEEHLGLPSEAAYGAGAFLALWTVLAVAAATRPRLRVDVVVGNGLWVGVSVVAVLALDLTTAGGAVVLAQAVAVAGLTALQLRTLAPRRPLVPA